MTTFKKYMHIERFGNDEVQGIELGDCYIFPKIDGTNASVWLGEDEKLHAGSRRRELSLEDDNSGFYKYACDDIALVAFLSQNPHLRLYGEWLVPHTLKTYSEDAWRKFYVFDVYNDTTEKFLSYDEYREIFNGQGHYGINYIPAICMIQNATYDNLLVELQNNVFLIEDGKGVGEGIVIKNYQYRNRFGRLCFAKMVRNEFKEKHGKEMGYAEKVFKEMVEQDIINKYLTETLIDKTYAKIVTEKEGWNSKYIPMLFGILYYDFVNEELWNAIKTMKNPTINFKTLYSLLIIKVKQTKPELF